ncbi:MAG: ADP-ribosylglycohydrolase family protein [Clostridia bacterium]|nr:ADP-ribosylglycohydrolase family protein [Clostridia bacterium]
MLKLNKKSYLDKLHACWLGKNIGGTIGGPYEGTRDMLDITGFGSKSGEPLPNDDLDLQLVWLIAMERFGAARLDANILADFWLDFLPPYWNEYGTCKTNLRLGLLPPMSGEVDNEDWKNSNGAWIRSEIWAALAPGLSDIAIKYAVADAMVDHGLSEGTHAEVFTATLQSLAYTESNIRTLIEAALTKIPEDGMVAKTIRLVMDSYDSGVDYRETRQRVVKFNESLGWFQAPANLGFVTIGLLYGEGDFKKSVLYAVNCGDDTDCTAATVGATLGIIGGTAAIPDDWKEFVGDRIVTISISGMYNYHVPKSCTELTDRIAAILPNVMAECGVKFSFTDGDSEFPEELRKKFNTAIPEKHFSHTPNSYEITHYSHFSVRVELDGSPRVSPADTRHVKLTVEADKFLRKTHKLQMRLLLPEGWSAGHYPRTLSLLYPQPWTSDKFGVSSLEFDVTVGEQVDVINRAYMEITSPTLCYPMMIPITFIG